MNATLLTATAATQVITNGVAGASFQPDMVWLKSRTNANNHTLYDSIRGVNNILYPNLTNAAATGSDQLTAFNSNGFTLGASENANDQAGELSVGWNWKAGGTAVSNTSGTITSSVSANTTSGFSIVTWTGNGTAGATVGHGLGVAPQMVIYKSRNTTDTWVVYHVSLGGGNNYLRLQTTGATYTGDNTFNSTIPSSTVLTLGNITATNPSNAMVAYCWTPIAGYSAFGSYTGNGSSDGPFVYTGFRPKFVLMKATSGSNNWIIYDTSRNTYNLTNLSLVPDSSAAENGVSTTTENTLDILSNGFKLRTSNALTNGSSVPYIYAAFAENPFKYANAR
jgi:hypothetical protein